MARVKGRKPEPRWAPLAPASYNNPEVEARRVAAGDGLFMNDRVTVSSRTFPDGLTHLSIKRNNRAPIRDWRVFQRIKNELCGPEREGVEIYPAESRLVDEANQYHLWVLPDGVQLPFGFEDRFVSSPATAAAVGAQQREFDEPPPDLDAQPHDRGVMDYRRPEGEVWMPGGES